MSAPMGGKKSSSSSNSSMVNTPASTPVTMANGAANLNQASPPPNNAPKYGTLVPNRIFVGGISANTTETELLQLFSNYGTVKAAKIIQDRAGVSKGYGFITFESEDDAKRLQREADNIVLRERKLNIAPAIKKQPFSRAFEGSSPPNVAPGYPPNFFAPSSLPFFQGGVAYYPQPPTGPTDPNQQPPTVYQTPSVYPPQTAPPQAAPYQPVMFPPQPIYMPQQYPMPMPYDYNYYTNGGGPFMVSGAGAGGGQAGGVPQSAGPGQMPQMQPRPNSPPRPQCYSQQMPSAAAAAATAGYPSPQDAVYYNMPMYPMDGPMYADPGNPLDAMSLANGVVSEEYPPASQQQQQQHPPSDGIDQSGKSVIYSQQQLNSAPPPAVQQQQSQQHQQQQQCDTNRQTTTPVVSLLSLDHQQEKDLVSMQSGRRRKPPPTPPVTHTHAPNSITTIIPNAYMPPHQQQMTSMPPPPPPNGFTYSVPYEYHYAASVLSNNTMKPPHVNGYDRVQNPKRSWRNYNNNNSNTNTIEHQQRRSVDTSSLSSPRTDSNSSASIVVDDVRHPVDDRVRTRIVPHQHHYQSSAPQQVYHSRNHPMRYNMNVPAHHLPNNNSTYHHQRRFPPNNKTYRVSNSQPNQKVPSSNISSQVHNNNNSSSISGHMNNNECARKLSSEGKTTTTTTSPPQTPGVTQFTNLNSQMQAVPQHFVAPARHRSRRSVRRNGSSGLGEIGAGDAPLSTSGNDSLTEACNKLDGLKL